MTPLSADNRSERGRRPYCPRLPVLEPRSPPRPAVGSRGRTAGEQVRARGGPLKRTSVLFQLMRVRLPAGHVLRWDGPPQVSEDLRAHLAGRLPLHLVPTTLVALPELPVPRRGRQTARPCPGRGSGPTPRRHTAHDRVAARAHGAMATGAGRRGHRSAPVVLLYEHPTTASLAQTLSQRTATRPARLRHEQAPAHTGRRIRTGLHPPVPHPAGPTLTWGLSPWKTTGTVSRR